MKSKMNTWSRLKNILGVPLNSPVALEPGPPTEKVTPPATPLEKPHCILIDDDSLIQMAWESSANDHQVWLESFSSAEAFFQAMHRFDKSTAIYLDSRLENGQPGEEVARVLYEMGFHNLRLATAFPPDFFEPMAWLKEIVGKEPPWLTQSPLKESDGDVNE